MRRKLLISAGLTLLALILLAYLVLVSPRITQALIEPLRTSLVQLMMGGVSRSLNGAIEIGQLQGSLLSDPTVQNLLVRDIDGSIIAEIATLRLRYDLGGLFRGRLQIRAIEVDSPQLTLAETPDGQLNLVHAVSPQSPDEPQSSEGDNGFPLLISLERLEILQGQIKLSLPSLQGVTNIRKIFLRLSGELRPQGLSIELQRFSAHAEPADFTLKSLRGAFLMQGGNVRFEDLSLQTEATRIRLNGTLPGKTQDATLQLYMEPLSVAEIGRLLDDRTLNGTLRAKLMAAGPPEAVEVRGRVDVASGSLDLEAYLDTVNTPKQYWASLETNALNLAAIKEHPALQSNLNLNVRADGEGVSLAELKGELKVDVKASNLGEIAIQPSQIHIAARSKQFQVRTFNFRSSVTQMTMQGGLDLNGHSDLSYQIATQISELRQLLEAPKLDGTLQLQGQAVGTWPDLRIHGGAQGAGLRFKDQLVEMLNLHYDVIQLGDRPQFEVQLLAHPRITGDESVMAGARQASGRAGTHRPRYEAQMQGSFRFDNAVQQLLIKVFQMRLEDHLWQTLKPLDMTFSADQLSLKPVRLVHADEFIELSGAIRGQQLEDLSLQAGRIDLSFLQRLLALPEWVGGRGDLQVSLDGALDDPRLHGELELTANPRHVHSTDGLHLTFSYAKQRFKSDLHLIQQLRDVLTLGLYLPTDLAFTDIPLEQRLLDAPLKVHLDLRQPDLSALHGRFQNLPELLGTLEGALDVWGTYARLNLDAKLELQQLGVKGVLEKIEAPVRLTAEAVTAPSVEALRLALADRELAPSVQNLKLQLPAIQAVLPDQDKPQPVELHNLFVRADAAVTTDGLHAQLHEFRVQSRAPNLPVTDLTFAAHLTPEQLVLDHLQVKTPRSEVNARKSTLLADQHVQLVLDIVSLQLDEFSSSLSPDLPSLIKGNIELTGMVDTPQLVVRLQYAGAQIDADLNAQLDHQPPRYGAKLRLESLAMAEFSSRLQGQLRAVLELEGAGFMEQERKAQVVLNVDSEGFNLAPGLGLHVRGDIKGTTLALEDFRVQSALAELTAQGVFSTTQPIALAYNMNLGDLTPLQPVLGKVVHAQGALSGEITGRLGDPHTQTTVNLRNLRIGELKCAGWIGQLTAGNLISAPHATINSRVVGLEAPSLPRSSLQLDGRYQAARGEFWVTVVEGPYIQSQLAGNLIQQAGYQTTIDRLRLQSGDWVWQNTGPIEVNYDSRGSMRLKEMKLHNGDQSISISGLVSAEGKVSAQTHVKKVQIRPAVHAFDPTIEIPQGRLSLELVLNGSLVRPQLQGSLRLNSLKQNGQSLGEINAQLNFTDTVLRSELHWLDQNEELLRVQGTVDTGESGALALRMQSSGYDLQRIAYFSKAIVSSAGRLELDMRVAGTLQQPQAYGKLEVKNGQLRLTATGEKFTDIQASVKFVGSRANIDRLHIGSQTGSAQLSGWLETTGFALERLDLVLEADQFRAMNTPAMKLRVTSNLALRGSLQDMLASGRITLPKARVRLDNLPTGEQKDVESWELTVSGVYGSGPEKVGVAEGKSPSPRPETALPFLRTDIDVTIPRNTWLQGKGTAVEIGGELKIKKKLQKDFLVSGYVETLRGFASVLGKKFDIDKGRVTFTGSQEIDPLLAITARHNVSEYIVYVDVTGTSKKPELKFRSDPELEEADVISLLAFGKTTDRLTSSEQSSLAAQGGGIAGGVAAGILEQTLGKSLGLDTISIGAGSAGVGRYLSQDVYLSYERIYGSRDPTQDDRGGNSVGLEYTIKRNLKIKGTSSDIGENALDLNWSHDY